MSNKFKITLLVGFLLVIGGSICNTLLSTVSAQSNYTIKVTKTTDGDFTVTNGAVYVCSYFDTTCTMTGIATHFIEARDVLVSSILDDFGKSPTIGYVKLYITDT